MQLVEPEDEELTDARCVAAVAVKTVPLPPELDFKVSSGDSGGLDGPVSAVLSEDVTHQLRPVGIPSRFSDKKMSSLVRATQAAAARELTWEGGLERARREIEGPPGCPWWR